MKFTNQGVVTNTLIMENCRISYMILGIEFANIKNK